MEVNGIEVAVAEHGLATGPVVILLRGFPELGYSWRHQVENLAAAGQSSHHHRPAGRAAKRRRMPLPLDDRSDSLAFRALQVGGEGRQVMRSSMKARVGGSVVALGLLSSCGGGSRVAVDARGEQHDG